MTKHPLNGRAEHESKNKGFEKEIQPNVKGLTNPLVSQIT
jgi:hypothetical protein